MRRKLTSYLTFVIPQIGEAASKFNRVTVLSPFRIFRANSTPSGGPTKVKRCFQAAKRFRNS